MRYDDRDSDAYEGDDPYDSEPRGYEAEAAEEEPGEQPAADPVDERLEQIDRKVGVRSYAGGVAIVIALAGAIIAVALALGARDEGATKDELQELKAGVSQATEEATKANQEELSKLSDQVDQLSGSIDDLQGASATTDSEISGIQSDIDDLQGQISDLGSADNSGGVAPDSGGGRDVGDELGDILDGN